MREMIHMRERSEGQYVELEFSVRADIESGSSVSE